MIGRPHTAKLKLVFMPHDVRTLECEAITLSGGIRIGAPIRIIREPCFSLLGKVHSLVEEPQAVQAGSEARRVEAQKGSHLLSLRRLALSGLG